MGRYLGNSFEPSSEMGQFLLYKRDQDIAAATRINSLKGEVLPSSAALTVPAVAGLQFWALTPVMATDGSKRSSVAPPPRSLNVEKFAEARASELEALHSIVANRLNENFRSRRNKRRRTTGYDNRESNKRFRKRAKLGVVGKASVGASEKEENKKVPRRIRRRVELRKNLEHGYSTSGDGSKRLRTHVWHAKRFTMTKLWGFYLPLGAQGRGRGSRALLKRFRDGALVHDACYHIALKLDGPEDSLLSILSMVLVPSPSVCSNGISRSVISGAVYGKAMLHHTGALAKPIAPVTYMWRPLQEKDRGVEEEQQKVDATDCGTQTDKCCSSFRQLLLWLHASAFNEGYDALKFACQKLMDETGILINCSSLEGQLGKLEVMGSRAFELLQKILHPITNKITKSSQLSSGSSLEHEDQIPSCAVLSLIVNDPRNLPEKRTAVVPEVAPNRILEDESENHSNGNASLVENWDMDFWDPNNGFSPPLEENVLCMEKHHQRLAFFCLGDFQSGILKNSNDVQHGFCPILLLKNTNEKGMIGWSVVLPLSWVKAFWIPLVTNGGHAIGLREKHWIACEVELPYFPLDFPDTSAYSSFMATEATKSDEREKLHPTPKQAVRVPILPPWGSVQLACDKESICLGDTHPHVETFTRDVASGDPLTNSNDGRRDMLLNDPNISFDGFISRTSQMLSYYLNQIHGNDLLLFPKSHDKKCFSDVMIDEVKLGQKLNGAGQLNCERKLCFVRVLLHAYKEGSFEDGAIVCAPRLSDISVWTSRSECTDTGVQILQSSVRSYFREQSLGKRELQLPEDTVSPDSIRRPVGFVTTGFVRGSKKFKAEALCETVLLADLREEQWREMSMKERRKEIYVLVRNLRSTAYRLALATIILEQQEEDVEFM